MVRGAITARVVALALLAPGCAHTASHEDASAADAGGITCTPIPTWSPSSVVLVPGQILVLDAAAPVDPARVRARFDDGAAVALVHPDGQSIALEVPPLAPGDHRISVEACGEIWSSRVTLERGPIVDDADALIGEVVTALSARIDVLEARGTIDRRAVAALREQVAGIDEALRALDPSERAAIAASLAANRYLYEAAVPMCASERCDAQARCLGPRVIVFVVQLLSLAALTAFTLPPANLIPLLGASVVIAEFADENRDAVYGGCLQPILNGMGVLEPLPPGSGGGELASAGAADFGAVPASAEIRVLMAAEYTSLPGVEETGNDVVASLRAAALRIAGVWRAIEAGLRIVGRAIGIEPPSESEPPTASFDRVDPSLLRLSLESPRRDLTLDAAPQADGTFALTFVWDEYFEIDAAVRVVYDNPGVRVFEQVLPVRVVPFACGTPFGPCCADGSCTSPTSCVLGRCTGGGVGQPCAAHDECESSRCSMDGECLARLVTAFRCATDSDCGMGEACVPDPMAEAARCLPVVACTADADCTISAAGTRCGPLGRCQAGGLGEPCLTHEDCGRLADGVTSLFCVDGGCAERPRTRGGLWCASDADCEVLGSSGGLQYVCTSLGVCGGLRGRLCGAASDCIDPTYPTCRGDVCAPTTASDGALGSSCTVGTDCSSGICHAGICMDSGGVGGLPCSSDAECRAAGVAPEDGLRCGALGFCNRGSEGDPCADDSHCRASADPYFRCRAGICSRGLVGDACASDADCERPIVDGEPETLACVASRCRFGLNGDPCRDHSDCDRIQAYDGVVRCGPTGYCQWGVAGDPCMSDDHCTPPCSAGTGCATAGGRGVSVHLQHYVCVDSACSPGWAGSPCAADDDCPLSSSTGAGVCGPVSGSPTAGVCQPGITGDPCVDDSDCATGYGCRFEHCVESSTQ